MREAANTPRQLAFLRLGWARAALALVLLSGAAEQARAAALPEVSFAVDVMADGSDQQPRRIHGTMRVHGWDGPGDRCLYLRYEDPDYGEDNGTARRFEALSAKAGRLGYSGGSMRIETSAPVVAQPGDPRHVIHLQRPPGAAAGQSPGDDLLLTFDATVPRLPKSHTGRWFYDGFLPELLPYCPPNGLDPAYYRITTSAHYTGTVRLPPGWEYAGPGAQQGGTATIDIKGRGLAFALAHHYRRRRFRVGAVDVQMLYHNDQFAELEQTVKDTLPTMERLFGPYPFPQLIIVETGELERHGLPGVIAMNRPHQYIFDRLQRSWLNWQHWVFTLALSRQWFGGAVAASNADDDWLISGTAEFATLEALVHNPARFNLFNPSVGTLRFLSFDYLQVEELTAASLEHLTPFATLTTSRYVTRDPVPDQNPLLFIKQMFALHQLKSMAGEGAFYAFLRGLTSRHLFGTLTPGDFHGEIGRLPSPFAPPLRAELSDYLARWWTAEGWPDFALTGFSYDPLPDGRWVSHVTARQEGAIDFPPLMGVRDESGRQFVTRATAGDEGWKAAIVTPNQPVEARVDPTHEAFDEDRFDNRSGGPELSFFPGGADTLRDDAYTVLWIPYALRRPGEPFFVGVQAMLFRYIQDGLLARLEAAPSGHYTAIDLSHQYQAPKYAITGTFDATQDYLNDRQIEATARRAPFLLANPQLSLTLKVRHKERMGEPGTRHETVVGEVSLQPPTVQRICNYFLDLSYEKAPREWSQGFEYDRATGTAQTECYVSQRVSLQLRAFRGEVRSRGDEPQSAQFRPTDLAEARLLLGQDPGFVSSIVSTGVDLLLPFYLPLPSDTLILTRQMRWRLFYDWGRSADAGLDYRSGGFGIDLPFGGDLAGAGSLAFTRLTVLVIAFDKVGGILTRKPSLVFDVTGEL